mmetsp:Transcript_18771/g.51608  ORF Transcript_18771/g.51608 Transcript_18771/m.51608 type:complete len:307 (+) Transcript_18771:198-1118(+)
MEDNGAEDEGGVEPTRDDRISLYVEKVPEEKERQQERVMTVIDSLREEFETAELAFQSFDPYGVGRLTVPEFARSFEDWELARDSATRVHSPPPPRRGPLRGPSPRRKEPMRTKAYLLLRHLGVSVRANLVTCADIAPLWVSSDGEDGATTPQTVIEQELASPDEGALVPFTPTNETALVPHGSDSGASSNSAGRGHELVPAPLDDNCHFERDDFISQAQTMALAIPTHVPDMPDEGLFGRWEHTSPAARTLPIARSSSLKGFGRTLGSGSPVGLPKPSLLIHRNRPPPKSASLASLHKATCRPKA